MRIFCDASCDYRNLQYLCRQVYYSKEGKKELRNTQFSYLQLAWNTPYSSKVMQTSLMRSQFWTMIRFLFGADHVVINFRTWMTNIYSDISVRHAIFDQDFRQQRCKEVRSSLSGLQRRARFIIIEKFSLRCLQTPTQCVHPLACRESSRSARRIENIRQLCASWCRGYRYAAYSKYREAITPAVLKVDLACGKLGKLRWSGDCRGERWYACLVGPSASRWSVWPLLVQVKNCPELLLLVMTDEKWDRYLCIFEITTKFLEN